MASEALPLAGIWVAEFGHTILGPSCGMILADLLHCCVGDNDRHDIAERDRLVNRAGLRKRAETVDEALQLIWMARREHHLVASLDKRCAECTALTP